MDHKQTEEWARSQLETMLLTLLEDIRGGNVKLKKYHHHLVIGPSTHEWKLEFTRGDISIKVVTP